MSDYLSNELWFEIFIRLPVKSILRFTGVCKSWKNLIKSEEFVASHLEFKVKNQKHFLLERSFHRTHQEEMFRIHDENNAPVLAELRSPFQAMSTYFHIAGTCNGLLCLSDSSSPSHCYGNVIIWNPLVGKSMYLPRPGTPPPVPICYCLSDKHFFGFGYDFIGRDYKVVSVVCGRGNPTVTIFRLSIGRWENISVRAPERLWILFNCQIYLNGYVHWIGNVEGVERNIIVSFDICEETFGTIAMPEPLATCSRSMKVAEYRGSLAVVMDETVTYSIWVMADYGRVDSWNQHVRVQYGDLSRWPCGFTEDGNILNVKENGAFGSFDPITLQYDLIRQYPEFDLPTVILDRSYYTASYMESLLFIDKGPEFSDRATMEVLNAATWRQGWG